MIFLRFILEFIMYVIKFAICYLFAWTVYKFVGPNHNWYILLLAYIYFNSGYKVGEK